MKSIRRVNVLLCFVNAVLILGAFQWLGCASAPSRPQQAPGFYLTGWNGVDYDCDINGKVGYPLYVACPTAYNVPSSADQHWSANMYIADGNLPPGLQMDSHGTITGIPTERGHWIVTVKGDNVYSNGQSYQGLTQQLRFHITGSGEVNE